VESPGRVTHDPRTSTVRRDRCRRALRGTPPQRRGRPRPWGV